jgi:hypothetical protein
MWNVTSVIEIQTVKLEEGLTHGKVKESHNRPGVDQRVPGVLGS